MGKNISDYLERQSIAQAIAQKLKTLDGLTDGEKELISASITDPLGEFCRREATFRLVEILDTDPQQANTLREEATEAIRDTIDYNELLYDQMDSSLREVLGKETRR